MEESLENQSINPQTIDWALAAILGHKSAHSFAIGPVAADPFISPLFVTITPALSILRVQRGRNNTLKIYVMTFPSPIRFTLPYYHAGHDLLS